jgi:hypothetical protein
MGLNWAFKGLNLNVKEKDFYRQLGLEGKIVFKWFLQRISGCEGDSPGSR